MLGKCCSFFFHFMSHSGIRIETLPDESHHFHIWLVYIPAALKVIGCVPYKTAAWHYEYNRIVCVCVCVCVCVYVIVVCVQLAHRQLYSKLIM